MLELSLKKAIQLVSRFCTSATNDSEYFNNVRVEQGAFIVVQDFELVVKCNYVTGFGKISVDDLKTLQQCKTLNFAGSNVTDDLGVEYSFTPCKSLTYGVDQTGFTKLGYLDAIDKLKPLTSSDPLRDNLHHISVRSDYYGSTTGYSIAILRHYLSVKRPFVLTKLTFKLPKGIMEISEQDSFVRLENNLVRFTSYKENQPNLPLHERVPDLQKDIVSTMTVARMQFVSIVERVKGMANQVTNEIAVCSNGSIMAKDIDFGKEVKAKLKLEQDSGYVTSVLVQSKELLKILKALEQEYVTVQFSNKGVLVMQEATSTFLTLTNKI